ncbi:Cu,Zn superoxide dismutase-like protein [Microthyrium microscopicum]|uniref:superoxide dismutase n=1 Tax=Microthyrium microscopicum TaxID=703497 RepID=A0A6A6UIA2_9PEZI|nr:Cu,Zn superoxide dismutase-like protein [Microthyrium microscopicum]
MYKTLLLAGLVGLASAKPQVPPSPVLLTTTKAGVVPVAPTPFPGVETIEGALIDDGPALPGFVGPGGNATVQSNLPAATYSAVLPSTNFDNLTGSTITGTIVGMAMQGGQGVMFNISFSGLPDAAMYGPLVYHIHEMPVSGGNCTTSLGHLDPTNRGELHACDTANPASCQAGDLAGKHGNITSATFMATYTDPYLSTNPNSSYFFGNRSIVIHSKNATRLTCANFAMGTNGSNSSTSTSASGSSPSSTAGASAANSLNCFSAAAYAMIIAVASVYLL